MWHKGFIWEKVPGREGSEIWRGGASTLIGITARRSLGPPLPECWCLWPVGDFCRPGLLRQLPWPLSPGSQSLLLSTPAGGGGGRWESSGTCSAHSVPEGQEEHSWKQSHLDRLVPVLNWSCPPCHLDCGTFLAPVHPKPRPHGPCDSWASFKFSLCRLGSVALDREA